MATAEAEVSELDASDELAAKRAEQQQRGDWIPGGPQEGDEDRDGPIPIETPQEPPSEPETPPADLPDPPEDPEGEVLILDAGGGQLSLAVGGAKPTSSVLKITGAKVGLDGQFKRGEVVTVELELLVTGVDIADKLDRTGTYVESTTRTHKAVVQDWRV